HAWIVHGAFADKIGSFATSVSITPSPPCRKRAWYGPYGVATSFGAYHCACAMHAAASMATAARSRRARPNRFVILEIPCFGSDDRARRLRRVGSRSRSPDGINKTFLSK